jgi:CBS domain-containing protein
MTTPPVTLQADSDYKSALRLMQDCMIHHLPVVDPAQRLAGIVAERDLLLAAFHYLGSSIEIGDLMQRDVISVRPETPLTDAALLMIKHTIGGLPVVNKSGRVVGVITETDIFRAFVTLHTGRPALPSTGRPSREGGKKPIQEIGRKPLTAKTARKSLAKTATKKQTRGKLPSPGRDR